MEMEGAPGSTSLCVKDRERDEFECRECDVEWGCECPDDAPDEPWLRRKEVAEEEAMMNQKVLVS